MKVDFWPHFNTDSFPTTTGIYVIGFSFPVVPRGQARIRVQLSAAHTSEQVKQATDAFIEIGKKKGILKA